MKLILVVLAFFLMGCNSAQPKDNQSIKTIKEQADIAYKEGDFEKALNLYNKTCEKGDLSSCHSLGVMYEDKNNTNRAIEFYDKSCNAKYAYSCFNLGLIYNNMKGENKDKSIKLFKKACELGDESGCINFIVLNKELKKEELPKSK